MTPRSRTPGNWVCCGFWVENKGLIVRSRPPYCNRHRSQSAKCKYSSRHIQFNTINQIKINVLSKDHNYIAPLPLTPQTNQTTQLVYMELIGWHFTNMKYAMCCTLKNDLLFKSYIFIVNTLLVKLKAFVLNSFQLQIYMYPQQCPLSQKIEHCLIRPVSKSKINIFYLIILLIGEYEK